MSPFIACCREAEPNTLRLLVSVGIVQRTVKSEGTKLVTGGVMVHSYHQLLTQSSHLRDGSLGMPVGDDFD